MSATDSIFAFNDRNNPSVYGFVWEHSSEELPQMGRDCQIVPGFEITQPDTPEPRSWIDEKVREGIQTYGFQMIDFAP
jgi:hypothetical protein